MRLRGAFVNRHDELRSGWRIGAFLLLTAALSTALIAPFWIFKILTDFLLRLLITAAILGATFISVKFMNRKPLTAVGLSLHPALFREFGLGLLLGFLMITGIYVVEYLSGFAGLAWRGLSLWECLWVIVSGSVFFLVAGAMEEILFRGYLLQTLMQAITFLPAMTVLALLFAVAHSGNSNATVIGVINVGLAAVWLSFAYLKTRSLWLPIGLHASWNFSQTTIFGFPTSGVTFPDFKLCAVAQAGPEWVTGGAFGPEGGALATVALFCCTWYILKSPMISTPEGIITLDSVEDLLLNKDGREASPADGLSRTSDKNPAAGDA
jgi:uncharacterized protein